MGQVVWRGIRPEDVPGVPSTWGWTRSSFRLRPAMIRRSMPLCPHRPWRRTAHAWVKWRAVDRWFEVQVSRRSAPRVMLATISPAPSAAGVRPGHRLGTTADLRASATNRSPSQGFTAAAGRQTTTW